MDRRYGSVERSDRSSSLATTVLTSAVSSIGTDPWTVSGCMEDDDVEGDGVEDEIHLEPKSEPVEDDGILAEVEEAPPTLTLMSLPMPAKRPRGRPRKHPLPDPNVISRVAKGRSKTGCITCRRRKKKCDETKPACMNCEKNAFVCQGYPTKTVWRSGREKSEEARRRRASFSHVRLEPIIRGVETAEDKVFFEHYSTLSSLFTTEGESGNAFKDMLLPLAVKHLGLMHSILSLSSRHIDYDSLYGQRLLESHHASIEEVRKRSHYHADEAMRELHAGIAKAGNDEVDVSARFGQMLCLVLQTLSDPSPAGEHRVHLQAYASLIRQSPPKPGPFLDFIQEVFQYHITLDELIYLPRLTPPSLNSPTTPPPYDFDWDHCTTTFQPCTVHLLGVSDGLFRYMTQITNIRNTIRRNMHNNIDPIVDYTSLFQAANIDAGIRDWSPVWPPGDSRDLAALLYKQMMWVYLWRTIYPPKTTTWLPDKRITQAVNDGIAMLKEVSSSSKDTTQALMLAPAFVLGCAAFEDEQREPIREAIGKVKEYRRFRNADTTLKVLEELWRLLDAKDERSWDWQAVAKGMGLDFLVT